MVVAPPYCSQSQLQACLMEECRGHAICAGCWCNPAARKNASQLWAGTPLYSAIEATPNESSPACISARQAFVHGTGEHDTCVFPLYDYVFVSLKTRERIDSWCCHYRGDPCQALALKIFEECSPDAYDWQRLLVVNSDLSSGTCPLAFRTDENYCDTSLVDTWNFLWNSVSVRIMARAHNVDYCSWEVMSWDGVALKSSQQTFNWREKTCAPNPSESFQEEVDLGCERSLLLCLKERCTNVDQVKASFSNSPFRSNLPTLDCQALPSSDLSCDSNLPSWKYDAPMHIVKIREVCPRVCRNCGQRVGTANGLATLQLGASTLCALAMSAVLQ
eukprot:gnl/TRDRNA2_/TRDRNA2_205428_c0_seq1.p1 gnl/TRDRNA2_/TRDRNA2_205428_c0~~gnl/TRDRNA2_/TRDRNA2_205428_c0_seq1.p1  ORF type:complete len:378 (+),score=12.74 gnl/TRDRNA2_/TRDRNA2_205428_c0_seq1:139-1134(+)